MSHQCQLVAQGHNRYFRTQRCLRLRNLKPRAEAPVPRDFAAYQEASKELLPWSFILVFSIHYAVCTAGKRDACGYQELPPSHVADAVQTGQQAEGGSHSYSAGTGGDGRGREGIGERQQGTAGDRRGTGDGGQEGKGGSRRGQEGDRKRTEEDRRRTRGGRGTGEGQEGTGLQDRALWPNPSRAQ